MPEAIKFPSYFDPLSFFDRTINCLDNKRRKIVRYINEYLAIVNCFNDVN